MCNRLRQGATKVPKEGKAWKVFSRSLYWPNAHKLCSMTGVEYKQVKGGWVTWDSNMGTGDGFCALTSYKEAARLAKLWKRCTSHIPVIKRIMYKRGLGKHLETTISFEDPGFQTIIVKSFRLDTRPRDIIID